MKDDLNIVCQMKDNPNIFPNGRRPQLLGKWKMTSIISKWKMTKLYWQKEDSLDIQENERPH